MDLLIVGDVHGCYHTFKKLVEDHWKAGEEILVQIGDLISKGPHSGECLSYWFELEREHPAHTIFIRGNHEQYVIDDSPILRERFGKYTLKQSIEKAGFELTDLKRRLSKTSLKWENESMLITHAGVARSASAPFALTARDGVLFNKGKLKKMDRVQVKGHSIVEGNKPVFTPSENAWYLDTGAWVKKYLSAVRFNEKGEKKDVVRVKTLKEDRV